MAVSNVKKNILKFENYSGRLSREENTQFEQITCGIIEIEPDIQPDNLWSDTDGFTNKAVSLGICILNALACNKTRAAAILPKKFLHTTEDRTVVNVNDDGLIILIFPDRGVKRSGKISLVRSSVEYESFDDMFMKNVGFLSLTMGDLISVPRNRTCIIYHYSDIGYNVNVQLLNSNVTGHFKKKSVFVSKVLLK